MLLCFLPLAGIGGYLSHNITAYYDTAVQLAYKITGAGTAADKLIHGNKGGRVSAGWGVECSAVILA